MVFTIGFTVADRPRRANLPVALHNSDSSGRFSRQRPQRRRMPGYLQTGQKNCYDTSGKIISCSGSGQDGELRKGMALPAARFETREAVVHDLLTGLTWTLNADPAEFPLTWQEALAFVSGMNQEKAFGHADWRMPNRRELRSLLHFEARKPALPPAHPFTNVFLNWYWTSTTAAINPAYAWYVHLEGARMFYGRKDQYYLLWPVRGVSTILPATGQLGCFQEGGAEILCAGTGQDQDLRMGTPWPVPRFTTTGETVIDRLTGLQWRRQADLGGRPVSWSAAFELIAAMNESADITWRLPNINELESLVDCSRFDPALPASHPFTRLQDTYWSSTTSFFEPDWAWALYLTKGATGVGIKADESFYVWPVADASGTPEG
jgi:hypothetical protein